MSTAVSPTVAGPWVVGSMAVSPTVAGPLVVGSTVVGPAVAEDVGPASSRQAQVEGVGPQVERVGPEGLASPRRRSRAILGPIVLALLAGLVVSQRHLLASSAGAFSQLDWAWVAPAVVVEALSMTTFALVH